MYYAGVSPLLSQGLWIPPFPNCVRQESWPVEFTWRNMPVHLLQDFHGLMNLIQIPKNFPRRIVYVWYTRRGSRGGARGARPPPIFGLAVPNLSPTLHARTPMTPPAPPPHFQILDPPLYTQSLSTVNTRSYFLILEFGCKICECYWRTVDLSELSYRPIWTQLSTYIYIWTQLSTYIYIWTQLSTYLNSAVDLSKLSCRPIWTQLSTVLLKEDMH